MKHSLYSDRVPQTYIMLLDDIVIGMYQFQNVDLDVRPDIYPWLTNIYILPKYRGLGYSKILLGSVRENAKKIGLTKVYLYTIHIGLYEKYGFKFISEIEMLELDNPVQRLYKLEI